MLPAGVKRPALRIHYRDRCTYMKITDALIRKFLENRCNDAEASAVARYLKKHPELMAMYLRSSWDDAGRENALPPGYAEEMLDMINAQIGKRTHIVRLRWFAAAASLLILLGAVWLYTAETRTVEQTLSTVVRQDTDSAGWKQHINTSGKVYSIKLQDGSVVKLAPKAMIKYREPFEEGKRNIYMEGTADFDVAQDKARPFTVRTKLFSTTVLGTSFRVSENAAGCNIRLFTGKVLIKALTDTLKGWKQDIVLLPGNQMKYNPAKATVSIERFNAMPALHPQSQNDVDANKDQDKIVFDNTPLPDVMKALIKKYHSPIEYDEDLLTGKYFSGEVLKGDSLSVLLKVIATMNGLQVAQKGNGYMISKSE